MRSRRAVAVVLATLVVAGPAQAGHDGTSGTRYRDAKATQTGGVVASISDYASAVGIDVLNRGGNAIDAAVAMVFAVGVTRPDMGGIGGGGFLVYRGAKGRTAALDFRELSPSTEEFDAEVLSGPGMHHEGSGHRVVGVPGVVAGMDAALDKLGSGTFSLGDLITNRGQPLAPGQRLTPYAHELARDGFEVSRDLAYGFFHGVVMSDRLSYYPETEAIYSAEKNPFAAYKMNFKQTDYARSLAFVAHNGPDAFYRDGTFPDPATGLPRDSIARMIATDMANAEARAASNPELQEHWPEGSHDLGYLTTTDFERYKPVWRTPLVSTYHGAEIVAAPPPSSGGVATIEILNLLEGLPETERLAANDLPIALDAHRDTSWARSSANHLHHLAEAQKLAVVDGEAYIADPEHRYDYDGDGASDPMPTATLTSKDYADSRRGEIDPERARFDYRPGIHPATTTVERTASHTNHLSVLDRDGNAVAVTTTLNFPFGSVVVAGGTGFLLNNELNDFGSGPNVPGPRKRPRTFMSPTIVVRDGKAVLATGGAGGATIPLGVVQMIVNTVDYGLDIAHAIDAERIEAVAWGGPDWCTAPPRCLLIESNRDEDARKAGEPEQANQRVPDAVLDELGSRGHHILPAFDSFTDDHVEYFGFPFITAVGFNPVGQRSEAISDPRHEYDNFDVTGRTFGQGAMAQAK